MKTPEEIKRGMEHCAEIGCKGCPYEEDCKMFDGFSTPAEDAYFYIQQLEQDNARKDERIRQLEQRVPRWISVEDEQKPKHHEEVLCRYVFDGDSQCFYAVLTYYAYGDNGYVTGQHFTGEGLHDMRVTHWMPLPEPPEEEKHE